MQRSRGAVDLAAMAMIAGLAGVILLVIFAWLARFPLPAEAAALANGREVIAYDAEGDRPRVLFAGDGRLTVGELQRSWSSVARFERPSWSISDRIVGYPAANESASLFALDCPVANQPFAGETVIFGTVDRSSIAAMEVAIDGSWRRYLVWPPGFMLPVDAGARVGDVRWLTTDDRVAWEIDRDGDGQIAPRSSGTWPPVAPRN